MNQTDFLQSLGQVKSSYEWSSVNGRILGKAKHGADRGANYDPVTAIARTTRVGNFARMKEAAKAMELASSVVNALQSNANRGHAQVLRGKVLRELGIN